MATGVVDECPPFSEPSIDHLGGKSARLQSPTVQRAMHIHPTLSELIPTMIRELKPMP
jgi:hypothetical protein